jgi:hypothetical protein
MNISYFRTLADTYESVQKVRIEAEGRLRAMSQGMDEEHPKRVFLFERIASLRDEEGVLQKEMLVELHELPVWNEFFVHVKGIGMTLACKLLALDLDKTRNKSSWDAYFGLTDKYWEGVCEDGHQLYYARDPLVCRERTKGKDGLEPCQKAIVKKELMTHAPRRKRGWKGFWNPRARTLYKIIGDSFLKTGKFYNESYYRFKEREEKKGLEMSKLQIHMRALRKTVQLFLSHYYQAQHEIDGTEARMPYQYEYLKHADESFIEWKDVVKYDKVKRKKAA